MLTTKQVAERLNVTHRAVVSWILKGYIGGIRMIDGTYRVTEEELTEFIRNRWVRVKR